MRHHLFAALVATALLGGCSSVGVGVGIPIGPFSIGVGASNSGVNLGVSTGVGPVGVGVGVNQRGQVSAGAGVGASTEIGNSGVRAVAVSDSCNGVTISPVASKSGACAAAMRATAKPAAGGLSATYAPPAHIGSAMIACRPTSWKAIFCALWRAAVAIATTFFTRAGWFTAQVSACKIGRAHV